MNIIQQLDNEHICNQLNKPNNSTCENPYNKIKETIVISTDTNVEEFCSTIAKTCNHTKSNENPKRCNGNALVNSNPLSRFFVKHKNPPSQFIFPMQNCSINYI